MLTRLGSLLYRERVVVLLTVLALLFDACIYGPGVFNLTKSGGYGDPSSESMQAQQLLATKLGGSIPDVIILMRSSTLTVTSSPFTRSAVALLSPLEHRPEIVALSSYYSTHNPLFISLDKHESFAFLQLASQDLSIKQQEYEELEPLLHSAALQVTLGGEVPVNLAASQQVSADLAYAETITFPILALLLILVFGSITVAWLPLLVGGVAIMGTLTVLRLLTKITDVSIYAINVVTMLGLGLAIDYALLIVTRFREELARDEKDVRAALERTLATAGRTVIFSALTVSISLLSLLLFPLDFLRSMGLGAIAAVLVVMLTSLTLLPAILALLGRRVNALSLNSLFKRHRQDRPAASEYRGAWYRLAEAVMRRPLPVALAALALLLTLGWPFLHINFATPDENVLPPGQPARVVSERLHTDFAQQGNAQLVIAVTTPGSVLSISNLTSLSDYVKNIAALAGVEHVTSLVTVRANLTPAEYQMFYAHPARYPQFALLASSLVSGNLTKITVELQSVDHSAATIAIVHQVRALSAPGGLQAWVDGITPEQIDLLSSLGATLPAALLVIILAIFVLLFLMTGSLVIPLKAILLNMLSLSATFGGLVWIFQDGHLRNLLHFQSVGSIDATQPVLIFAIAFGLSMDYEVFLLSRIKERFDQTGDNRLAVSSGLQRTGRLITSEALLLATVLAAFGSAKIIFIQEIGIGLASAVIMDATLIRMLLVPATMRLLGNANWWAPAPLRWLRHHIGLAEAPDEALESFPTQPHKVHAQKHAS
jgi:RND superfamily putative drug exporter